MVEPRLEVELQWSVLEMRHDLECLTLALKACQEIRLLTFSLDVMLCVSLMVSHISQPA